MATTYKARVWMEFKKNRMALAGLIFVAMLFVMVALSSLLVNDKPLVYVHNGKLTFPAFLSYTEFKDIDLRKKKYNGFKILAPIPYSPSEYNLDAIVTGPSREHLLGTDAQGRDLAARMIYGARVSILVGFIAVFIYVSIGIVVGAAAGYYGGVVDLVISRIIEIIICFPTFFLILTILALIGPSLVNVMVVIGLTSWTGIARLVRGEFLKLRELDYVTASKAIGARDWWIIFRHMLPNAMAPVLVSATFGIASTILAESSLSFLGFGVQPPTPSWGDILSQSRSYMDFAWWLTIFPGFAIFLTITSYNMVGEGLRDAMDPKLFRDK